MAKFVSMEHVRFVLHDVLNISSLTEYERYADFDKGSFDMLLSTAKDVAETVFYPSFREMDEQPAVYENGTVKVHPAVGEVMKAAGQNGMIGATYSYEDGGMQMPHCIFTTMGYIYATANNHLTGYPALTHGSAELIVNFGSQELKDTYVPRMTSGEWAGTMCLTEPQAGSSLSDIVTSATPNDDGSYAIKGQKIFISGGDHEYCDNFVHLVLTRIKGAPAGTKGISLMVVPKKRLTADGGLESNDVTTAGDYQKMGQKGYCTTHLAFGEADDCRGWLVGEANKGLKYMFQMMNAARIDVGYTAAAVATAAYYASLQYAKERPQGRRILSGGAKNINNEPTLIINHPDVRRMLLLQRSIAEGATALLAHASYYHDMSEVGPEEDRKKYHNLLEILTPMAKTYPSERGRDSISNGLQILGGYGYCSEFVLQQYLRDVRIMSLYEGTTGIQSLDLLGRKIVMNNGEAMKQLTGEIIATIKEASQYDNLVPYADKLKSASKDVEKTLMHLLSFAMKGESERYIADATIFMDMMSNVTIAWIWLKLAVTAQQKLSSGEMEYEKSFYENKILTMQFYFKYELPRMNGCMETLMHPEIHTIPEDYPEAL